MTDEEIHERVSKFCTEMLPEGCVYEGYVLVIPHLDPDSGQTDLWLAYDHEQPTHSTVGLLEMVKDNILRANDENQ